ncbi:Lnb N-terminal periplasmic domain-containing protein [Algiphilus aromaticivorans]|uniref:Lnb N-terminal periplasmic domain-containing protein n=1 Tax=Algiphilus aromaticivorans TaxID=382454 RepID=UPI000693F1D3|nr:DUF4105 domain-containing protein [Algiphilus aromaticivorans]
MRRRFFMRIPHFLLLLLLGGTALPAHAELTALQAAADRQQLHADPAWQRLLHMEPGLLGARSAIASDWFFLAPGGHRNPRAELHATLRAFVEGTEIAKREEAAACVFGLRWRLLDKHLDLRGHGLDPPECGRRSRWLAALNPQRAWLVFPSAYLNSPASMFGHTLLRIDGAEGSEEAPLLAYAVNFAAETEEDNGLVYAARGLTGGYTGRFAVMPYYEKVREYARIENRDLWEYPLQIDQAALERVLLHLWELRGADFDYYFFTKNCSFQLLTLLEAALPERNLRAGLEWWAIPTDTVRALRRQELVGAPQYRPALSTSLADRARRIGDADTQRAVAVAQGELAPEALPSDEAQRNARLLDVAHDWLYYRTQSGAAERDTALPRARKILGARAATGAKSGFADPQPPATTPDRGHDTARLRAGFFAEDGGHGAVLGYRPAYHDLLDAQAGYDSGGQVAFANSELLWDAQDDRLSVGRLDIVDIVSLSPRDVLFRPISWRVGFGARRRAGLDTRLGGYIDGGPGLTWRQGKLRTFVFGRLALDAAKDMDKGYGLGGGGTAGLHWGPARALSLLLEIDSRSPLLGGDFERHELRGGAQWHWAGQTGLRLEGFYATGRGPDRSGLRLELVRYLAPAFAERP